MTRRVLVCGAGGFIGNHLVRSLKRDGHWVRGVDLRHPPFSTSGADEFLAYARTSRIAVRIARLHNVYGPENPWRGGREKAAAAICRKVSLV